MARSIRQRWLLVLLVAAGQTFALLVASVWLVNWLDIAVSQLVRQRVQSSTAEYAAQFAVLINHLGLRSALPSTPDGERLQAIIETVSLPGGGFLSVIDRNTGQILSHPRLGEGMSIADVGTTVDESSQIIGQHALDGLNAIVRVHQSEAVIRSAVGDFTRQVRFVAVILSLLLVIFMTLLTALIVRRYENRLGRLNENLEHLVEIRSRALLKSRSAVILGLAKLAESRDDQTGEHLDRIRHYVVVLARAMKADHPEIDDDFIETLGDTSSLHDIGKVGIPDAVLLHPGKLNAEQRQIIEKHPTIGGDTLLAIKRVWGDDPFLIIACEIAFAHHERWDGDGYPFGLSGADIPLPARIVAVADVYDALTIQRVYKPAMTHEQAVEAIQAGAGTQFDPQVVKAFLHAERDFHRFLNQLDLKHLDPSAR